MTCTGPETILGARRDGWARTNPCPILRSQGLCDVGAAERPLRTLPETPITARPIAAA